MVFIDNSTLKEIYKAVEEARMLLWPFLLEETQEIQDDGACSPVNVEEIEGVFKITVRDILPRNKDLIKKKNLQIQWYSTMSKALKEINRKFDALIVVIVLYLPAGYVWDVDNRPYKMIIDTLRYNHIIPDDSWNKLSFMVIGKTDKDNPRTEIYLIEMPKKDNWWMDLQRV